MKIKVTLLAVLLLTGCGYGSIFSYNNEPDASEIASPNLPDMQSIYMTQAYESAATRITNKMLDDTSDIYETAIKPKLYIKQIVKISPNLPDGFHSANRAMKQLITGSAAYTLVNKIEDADYILETNVSEFIVGEQPGIIIKQTINDKNDQPLRAWDIVIKQMAEDKSWW